jgi:hypothetical protein
MEQGKNINEASKIRKEINNGGKTQTEEFICSVPS